MLDKKSKTVLKFIISNFNGNFSDGITLPDSEFNVSDSELNTICLYLFNIGLLDDVESATDCNPQTVYLSYKGLNYFNRYNRIKYWLIKNWINLLTLIIAIATLIVTMIR